MLERWARARAEGKSAVVLTPEGRAKIRETARRTMRMRRRRREAGDWAEWMMEHHRDYAIRMWGDARREVVLRPYETALESGGAEELDELAELAGIDLRSLPDGADLMKAILARYPTLNIAVAAEHLRKGSTGPTKGRPSELP